MSGSLCDAVLDSTGSAAELESLARSNLFVVPLDSNGHWYRDRHLFREPLRAELERVEPDLVPRLLARAVAWSAANGETEAAIGYAQDFGDVDQVSGLVEQCVLPAFEAVGSRTSRAGSAGWRRMGRLSETRRSPWSAHCLLRSGVVR